MRVAVHEHVLDVEIVRDRVEVGLIGRPLGLFPCRVALGSEGEGRVNENEIDTIIDYIESK